MTEDDRGLSGYAETANSDMRHFARVALDRGLSLRRLAEKLNCQPSTVGRHMKALQSSAKVIARYELALGLDNRDGRRQRGAHALNAADIKHYRGLLLRFVVSCDEYADPAKARKDWALIFDSAPSSVQREVVAVYANAGDAREALRHLEVRTGRQSPIRVKLSAANDGWFWDLRMALRGLGVDEKFQDKLLDDVREHLGRDSSVVRRNDMYLVQSVFGQLLSSDVATREKALDTYHGSEKETEQE
jgi:hypothetical protein